MFYTVKNNIKRLIPASLLPAITRLYFGFLSFFYRGNAVSCPWCKGRFRKFPRFERSDPPEYICPRCGTLGRHRLLWHYLQNEMQLDTASLEVLHFAPEAILQQAFRVLPAITYTSADLKAPLAEVKTDITKLVFGADTFDLILCSHVLCVVPDDQSAMQELYRVLQKGGRLLLQEWYDPDREMTLAYDPRINTPHKRLKTYGHWEAVRKYGRDLQARLEAVGFSAEVMDYGRQLDADTKTRHGIPDKLSIHVCSK